MLGFIKIIWITIASAVALWSLWELLLIGVRTPGLFWPERKE